MTGGRKVFCWRCMRREVMVVGHCCPECEVVEEEADPGVKAKPIEEWSLEELVKTQKKGPIPGGAYYEKMVKPAGMDPTERVEGEEWWDK